MGDDDWDIGGIVRSCNISRPNNVVTPNLDLKVSPNDVWNSSDKYLAPDMTSFNGLSEIFSLDFPIACRENSYDQVIIMNQNINQQLYLHSIQPVQFIQQIIVPQSRTSVACVAPTTTTPHEWINLQQLDIGANIYPNFNFSMMTPLTQTRTRNNQSIRLTYELLQEELKNDIWTWRKYGQKHIKGSPFPRNYYKCSTSKHCEAKKQIEKSPKDENVFLVSCSGEHNHDPPMNRRYLASCNGNSKFKLPKGINILPKASILNASTSSSKRVKHSRVVASPIIATNPPLEIGSKNKMVVAVVQNKGDGKEKVDMNEDIFMGFDQLQGVTTST
ncbi:probable WRKY transcription factor 27 [Solanum verrucosum]|uniref:probable WRKY transcription factor 27 n=1 Tax=Solanum verrucosum TaxID=315347 RepID=UPI0020D1D5C7|nr:probable WRKY transcription factor 27 [Solanum verrucosum]